METRDRDRLDRLIRAAKRDTRKGDYRAFEWYKSYLREMALPATEYESAVRKIASALVV